MTPATSPSVIRLTERAGAAHRRDQVGVTRAIEDHGGDGFGGHPLGLGEVADVFLRRRVEIDHSLGVAGADRDLVHVDVGRVQERAAFGHGEGGYGARHVLGAQRRALQRVDRNVDLEAGLGADLFADEQHRRLIHLALADDDGPVDRQIVEFAAHGIDGGLVGGLLVAAPA